VSARTGGASRRVVRVGLAVLLVLLGAVVGLAGVAIHGETPGLLLTVAGTAAAAVALPPGPRTRLPFALGWVALVGYATAPRPEGDYVVAQNVAGYALLGLGLLLLLHAVVTLRPRDPGGGAGAGRAR